MTQVQTELFTGMNDKQRSQLPKTSVEMTELTSEAMESIAGGTAPAVFISQPELSTIVPGKQIMNFEADLKVSLGLDSYVDQFAGGTCSNPPDCDY